MALLVASLAALNDILTAGIAITAFCLLLYALTFNLRDRVARAFAALLAYVTAVYFCDAVVGTTTGSSAEVWLRLQWVGIAFIPVGYLHFTDALLATTGLPSRGRRRAAIRVLYLLAGAFLLAAAFTDGLVQGLAIDSGAAHLQAGPFFPVFMVYFAGSLIWAGWNFRRAYGRTQTSTTRRRMVYLMSSAAAPALGTFPFLLLAGQAAQLHAVTFWIIAVLTNVAVIVLLVVMGYAVAYFGVTQPDRVVKARLFQWLLRGPIVASTVLAVFVLVSRYGPRLPGYDPRLLPALLVAALLVLQFAITLVRLPIERALFYGADNNELRRLQVLEERLLTSGDLRQFLEAVLASLCDALRSPAAFVVAIGPSGKIEYEVSLGPGAPPRAAETLPPFSPQRAANGHRPGSPAHDIFEWGDYWLLPLRGAASDEPLGLLGWRSRGPALGTEEHTALRTLAGRAALALEDRRLQQDVFSAIEGLLPQIERIQQLRASAGPAGAQPMEAAASVLSSPDLAVMIRNALSHYWGGPKLTSSPLLRLRVVEQALREHDGNPANAMRAVLQQAIERIRPEGQRKYTAEWILYNILEMKFLQERRVRDVALRLAVSEADLYRKQRAAIEQVAQAIADMEREAGERATDYEIAG